MNKESTIRHQYDPLPVSSILCTYSNFSELPCYSPPPKNAQEYFVHRDRANVFTQFYPNVHWTSSAEWTLTSPLILHNLWGYVVDSWLNVPVKPTQTTPCSGATQPVLDNCHTDSSSSWQVRMKSLSLVSVNLSCHGNLFVLLCWCPDIL